MILRANDVWHLLLEIPLLIRALIFRTYETSEILQIIFSVCKKTKLHITN